MLACLALHLPKPGQCLLDLAKHGLQRILLDTGIAPERRERLALPLQFLHQVRFQIRAARDFGDLEQRGQRGVMFARVFLSQKEGEALEKIFETQQRSDSLIEGVLVKDQARSPRRWSKGSMAESEDILMPHQTHGKSARLITFGAHFQRRW
jgi:hypothetical protein